MLRLITCVCVIFGCGGGTRTIVVEEPEPPKPVVQPPRAPTLDESIAKLSHFDPAHPETEPPALAAITELAARPDGLPTLDELVALKTRPPLVKLQTAALVALVGAATKDPALRGKVGKTLVRAIAKTPADFEVADETGMRVMYANLAAPALGGITSLHVGADAVDPLLDAMVRHPALFAFVKRALVASGPAAKAALVEVLLGTHRINRLVATEHLDQSCSPGKPCKPLSIVDHHAAEVLGHFYDPATVPALVTALRRAPLPYFIFEDGRPGPDQRFAIAEALRRCGGDAAAAELVTRFRARDPVMRLLAIASYPYVTGDPEQLPALRRATREPVEDLRHEAAIAISRLSNEPRDIALLRDLAKRSPQARGRYLAAIPRIALAAKCGTDLACFAAADTFGSADVIALVQPYIADIATWEPIDREELAVIALERAVFELRRRGTAAQLPLLLELAGSDRSELRAFAAMALPRVAPSPCDQCAASLATAAAAAKGPEATYDLELLREYFVWNGTRP